MVTEMRSVVVYVTAPWSSRWDLVWNGRGWTGNRTASSWLHSWCADDVCGEQPTFPVMLAAAVTSNDTLAASQCH